MNKYTSLKHKDVALDGVTFDLKVFRGEKDLAVEVIAIEIDGERFAYMVEDLKDDNL